MTDTEERRAGPGRPHTTDTGAIALVAVRLFLERGFDNVTMADVAEAAGVGRSTLLRYFPSKGSLLWYQHDLHDAEFRQAMVDTPAGVPLADAVFDAYRRFMDRHSHELALAKTINAVIATQPASSTGKWDAFAEWAGFIAEFAAERLGGDPADAANRQIGLVLWSAIWSAVETWAVSDEPALTSYLSRARTTLRTLEQPS